MPVHTLTLLNRREIAKGTIECSFSKPPGFTFKPGQYAGFTLIGPSEVDANGITRRFSFASSPHDEDIVIATRVQGSAYKRVLNSLPLGSEMKFAGPAGNFTLHDDTSVPAVLMAGGIGITPFYSMIKHAAHHHTGGKRQVALFYGNQTQADTAYFDELAHLQQNHSPSFHFNFIPVMANPAPDWTGETGFISDAVIAKYLSNIKEPIYYLCGPLSMIKALQAALAALGVEENQIKVEDFPGY